MARTAHNQGNDLADLFSTPSSLHVRDMLLERIQRLDDLSREAQRRGDLRLAADITMRAINVLRDNDGILVEPEREADQKTLIEEKRKAMDDLVKTIQ